MPLRWEDTDLREVGNLLRSNSKGFPAHWWAAWPPRLRSSHTGVVQWTVKAVCVSGTGQPNGTHHNKMVLTVAAIRKHHWWRLEGGISGQSAAAPGTLSSQASRITSGPWEQEHPINTGHGILHSAFPVLFTCLLIQSFWKFTIFSPRSESKAACEQGCITRIKERQPGKNTSLITNTKFSRPLFYRYFLIFLPENMYFSCDKGEHSYHVYHFIKHFLWDKMIINSVPFSKVRRSCGVTGPEKIK